MCWPYLSYTEGSGERKACVMAKNINLKTSRVDWWLTVAWHKTCPLNHSSTTHSSLYFWPFLGTREHGETVNKFASLVIHLFMCPFHQLVVTRHFAVSKKPRLDLFELMVIYIEVLCQRQMYAFGSVWIGELIFNSFVCWDCVL